jgi:hypothetical protein
MCHACCLSCRSGEAEAELLNLVSHEEASPEACLAGLKAALAAPGGVPLARWGHSCGCRRRPLLSSDRMPTSQACVLSTHVECCCSSPHAAVPFFRRSALSLVLERFAEEPGMVVELVRAALAAAAAGEAGAAGTSGAGEGPAAGGSPAEALALELVRDDRLLEAVCEEASLRRQLLGLLWNHAVHALTGRQASETALAFFTAALPLLGGSSSVGGSIGATQIDAEGGSQTAGPLAVECRRAQALCCLGAGQFDRCGEQWLLNCLLVLAIARPSLTLRQQCSCCSMPLLLCLLSFERRALEFLAAAEELQPGSLPTGMLRLSVQLAAKSEAGAVEAVAALAASAAAEPDALRLACCECVDAGVHGAARQALLSLLERCAAGASSAEGGASTAGLQAAGYEATVFQNLIKLVLVRGWLHGCTTLAANSPHRTSWSRALSHQLALLRQLPTACRTPPMTPPLEPLQQLAPRPPLPASLGAAPRSLPACLTFWWNACGQRRQQVAPPTSLPARTAAPPSWSGLLCRWGQEGQAHIWARLWAGVCLHSKLLILPPHCRHWCHCCRFPHPYPGLECRSGGRHG